MARLIAHKLFLLRVCDRRAYPRRFLGHVGRTPYRTHMQGDGLKLRRGKGVKTVCIAAQYTSDNRCLRTRAREGTHEMNRLAHQVSLLRSHGLLLPSIMVVALLRGVQPLQQRYHPLWKYNYSNDSTRSIKGEFHERHMLAQMLVAMFKRDESNLLKGVNTRRLLLRKASLSCKFV